MAEHGHQVQRLIGFTLLDESGVAGKLLEEIGQRQLVIRRVLEFLLEQLQVARQILGSSVHSCFIALSIAAKSWPIVASVSSPMLETRKVVPLILP